MAARKKIPDTRVTPVSSVKSEGLHEILTTKEDRTEREGGLVFWLTKDAYNAGHRFPLPADRTMFVECNDGWYAIYVDGERTCFRWSPKKINSIKNLLSEPVNKI